MRTGEVERKSLETHVRVQVNLDESGNVEVDSGIGFFDHMLSLFAAHGGFNLKVYCIGDLQVDGHHSVEDIGIVMGQAFRQALGDRKDINRYGYASIPMDESLTEISLDISGRPYLHLETPTLWICRRF